MHAANQLLVTFLLNVLWQAALLAFTGWICSRLLRNAPGHHLYRLWVSCLALSLLLPLFSLIRPAEILPAFRPIQVAVAASSASSGSSFWQMIYARILQARISLGSVNAEWLAGLYLLFLAARLVWLVRSWQKTKRLRQSAYRRQIPRSLTSIVERCRHVFALESIPVLCSGLARGPITIGISKPVVIIPEFLFLNGNEEQWLSTLAHEFAHVRRNDFLFNLVQELISSPIFFHPAILMMKQRISAARERACDKVATGQVIEPASYARALVSIAGMMPNRRPLSRPDYSLGIFDADILEERIMKLLRNNSPSRFWTTTSLLITTACMLGVCTSVSAVSVRVDEGVNAASIVSFGMANSQAQEPVKLGPGITPPKIISKVQPSYPVDAKKAKHEGIVQLALVIGADGKIENIRVSKPLDPSLDKSAIDAVRQWTFEPATKDGKPVKVEVHLEINFSLKK